MFDLAKLWPYAWEYCSKVAPVTEGRRVDVGIAEIMFVHDLGKGVVHENCSLPNKAEASAAWNALTDIEQQTQTRELYKMDDVGDFYKKMVKLYNAGKFDVAACEALVEEFRAYMIELEKEREELNKDGAE